MRPPAFHGRLTVAVTALVLVGAALAVVGAVGAATHGQPTQLAVFLAVAAVLSAVAVLVARRVGWAVAICLVALAGQSFAVVGSWWELARGVSPFKADELRHLGFDPRFGVGVNLVFSAVGFGLFCWFAIRWVVLRRGSAEG
jgi:hypothetical protein